MRTTLVRVFCGIDWAEAHHDVALVNSEGALIAKRRISDDAAGFAALVTIQKYRRLATRFGLRSTRIHSLRPY